jgi:hypothetical protein
MKPTKKLAKLTFNKEVLRTLTSDELAKVDGGALVACAGRTYAGSGCSSLASKCWQVP